MFAVVVNAWRTHARFMWLSSIIMVSSAAALERALTPNQLLFIAHGVFQEFWTRKYGFQTAVSAALANSPHFAHMYPFPFSWMSSFIELIVFAAIFVYPLFLSIGLLHPDNASRRYSVISFASLNTQRSGIGFPDAKPVQASRKDYFILASTLTLGRALTLVTPPFSF
jgi:hypothetical protein